MVYISVWCTCLCGVPGCYKGTKPLGCGELHRCCMKFVNVSVQYSVCTKFCISYCVDELFVEHVCYLSRCGILILII